MFLKRSYIHIHRMSAIYMEEILSHVFETEHLNIFRMENGLQMICPYARNDAPDDRQRAGGQDWALSSNRSCLLWLFSYLLFRRFVSLSKLFWTSLFLEEDEKRDAIHLTWT